MFAARPEPENMNEQALIEPWGPSPLGLYIYTKTLSIQSLHRSLHHKFMMQSFNPLLSYISITSVFLFLAFFLRSTRIFRHLFPKKIRLPPSPPKLPFIGNLHQLSSLPHRPLLALSKKYGPLMLLKLGQKPTLVVSSSELAREVLRFQDHIFASRPSLKVPREIFYQGKDIAFAPYGEYWRQMKKVAVLHLLSNKSVRSYRAIREEEVGIMIDKVIELSSQGTINLTEILSSLAMDIASAVAVGKWMRDEESLSTVVAELIKDSAVLLGAFHWGDYFPWLGWMSRLKGLDARVRKTFEKSDEFLDNIVARRASNCAGEGENGSRAFLDVLLSLEKELNTNFPFDRQNIKAIIMDMMGAGTDSTYMSMEWVMAELFRNTDVMIKLKQEIRSIVGSNTKVTEENLAEMNYLKAVIKETFRLHPPGPLLVPRESMEETMINGYKIPKHTRVLVNVWAIGRDPNVWEAPEKFWPERFMDNQIDFKGHDYELIPFGAGRRICPGIQFTTAIIELAVANLVHQFNWKLPGCTMTEEDMDMMEAPGLNSRKKINLHIIATPCSKVMVQ